MLPVGSPITGVSISSGLDIKQRSRMDRNAKIVHDNGAENIIGDHRGLRFTSIGIGNAVAASLRCYYIAAR